jgi:hypothetical protein
VPPISCVALNLSGYDNSKGKRRASSRSRTRSTESEENKVEEPPKEIKEEEEEKVQPQDQDQDMTVQADPHPEEEDVLLQEEKAEEPDANPPELNRQNLTHTVVQINTKLPNISTLEKKLVILTHGNFTAWHSSLQGIAYYRNWADCVLHTMYGMEGKKQTK